MSVVVLAVMFAVGIAAQLVFGGIDMVLLAWPVSGIAVGVIVLAVAGLALYREKPFFGWLTGVPFSVSLMGAVLVCCLAMGLMPSGDQLPFPHYVTSSWPFVLLYLTLLISLGCLIVKVVAESGFRRWGFLLNHIGLWLVLTGGGVGSADHRELTVRITEGETAGRVSEHAGAPALPFAIRLDDFRMEEYPVRWGVVDIRTGRFQPEKRPVFYDTEAEAFAADGSGNGHLRVASTLPEPSYFGSDITVFTSGGQQTATVEVNHPYRRGSWSVYQSGYDREAGKESTYSIFQLVRDPWLPVVYAGIAMLALGALSMFKTRKRKADDMG